MLDYDTNGIFEALEELSLMPDEEFENARLEFEQNGLNLERDEDGRVTITVKE